jgi:hypothetical protein
MKTAKQWAARVQNSKEPWEKLVWEIQNDALTTAADKVAEIAHEQSSGRAVMLLADVSAAINQISVAAMPNKANAV